MYLRQYLKKYLLITFLLLQQSYVFSEVVLYNSNFYPKALNPKLLDPNSLRSKCFLSDELSSMPFDYYANKFTENMIILLRDNQLLDKPIKIGTKDRDKEDNILFNMVSKGYYCEVFFQENEQILLVAIQENKENKDTPQYRSFDVLWYFLTIEKSLYPKKEGLEKGSIIINSILKDNPNQRENLLNYFYDYFEDDGYYTD
ncbi:hypothetical protein [Stenoxybacter acetivorans]|uniref:hypothetical protein n=1 Tax=Stenoxybacter acetivorans TaxID=422441 RepID=UPI00056D8FAC|nr:hypothetical protein [Stenoxybacter acetivorans]